MGRRSRSRRPHDVEGGAARFGRVVAALLLGLGVPCFADRDPAAEWVFEQVQLARHEAGVESLRRRDDLDAVAAERATVVAALPHDQRLAYAQPIGEALRGGGIEWFGATAVHLDMVRGYTRPEVGFLHSWKRYETAWDKVLSPKFSAIGLATRRAADGWVIFVAVYLEELPVPDGARSVELRLIEAVNDVRADAGAARLIESRRLSDVARAHSEDMLRRNYFAHVDPEGHGSAERVNLAGIAFQQLGENLLTNRGMRDPVASAVRDWMESPGHRTILLDPAFEVTGVGVALGDDGRFYFTQLFLREAP